MKIIYYLVKSMQKNSVGLTTEEAILFTDVFESSLRVYKRDQFFSWLQGSFQSLLPHEILLCGVRLRNQEYLHFESFASTRYFTEHHISLVTNIRNGLITRVISTWLNNNRPILIADELSVSDLVTYRVPFVEPPLSLRESELKNIAAHGVANREGEVVTFFSFSRISGQLNGRHAYILELLVPHIHTAFLRTLGNHFGRKSQNNLINVENAKLLISLRETEVLKWVQSGKTNPEIAAILYISTNTVKNHVHKAISKLGVENRAQAVSKAFKLGVLD